MLKTKVGDIEIENCIYNASGPRCTYLDELNKLKDCENGILLTKSCTLHKRDGNAKPKYYSNNLGSINSNGLENMGYKFYNNYAEKIKNKPYFVSVSGMTKEENEIILKVLSKNDDVDMIEFNLSCPNVLGKSQAGYNLSLMKDYLDMVTINYNKKFGIKLPPYFDDNQFDEVANIINNYNLICFVTCINSVGNTLIINPYTESTLIKPKNGHGGLGGYYIKPIGLANVRQFYKRLRKDIDIIGVGGIYTGIDAFEYILCGAKAVQIGTCYYEEGITCFNRISTELKNIMISKLYNNIEDFRGKLHLI
jgi:dihydroorotate dehydrogenase (fumarate)